MIKNLRHKLNLGRSYFAIEIRSQQDGYAFQLLKLKQEGQELQIQERFLCQDLNELRRHIPKNTSVILNLNSSSVLIKKVDKNAGDSEATVRAAFPNLNLDDFYYARLDQKASQFVALSRRDYVQKWLKAFEEEGILIGQLQLGFLSIAALLPYIEVTELALVNGVIKIDNGNIVEITRQFPATHQSIEINGISASSEDLLVLSSIINSLAPISNLGSNLEDLNTHLKSAVKAQLFAPKFIKLGFGSLFVVLLINFFVFNHYYKGVSELTEASQSTSLSQERLKALSVEVLEKEQMAQVIVNNDGSQSAYYINAIINTTPESILFKTLNYQPLGKKIKENKPILVRENRIEISGNMSNAQEFSLWLQQLEQLSWAKEVRILYFEDETLSKSSFLIELLLNDDY